MRTRLACAGFILAVALSGCLPEARLTWSPDGRHALVRAGDGLYVCDGDGKFSARVVEDVPAAAWMPDSKQFIAASGTPLKTWDALVPHLSDARKQAAMAEAAAFRNEIIAYRGDWKKFAFKTPSADIRAALICMRDQYEKELSAVVGPDWAGLKSIQHKAYLLQLFELAGGQAKPVRVLLESLEPIAEIRAAPSGKAFAWAAPPYPAPGGEAAFALHVASLAAPDKPVEVASGVSIFFDWTADGRSLVYAWTSVPDPPASYRRAHLSNNERQLFYARDRIPETPGFRMGSITATAVVDADGALLASTEVKFLAAVLFFDSMPVRCLPDGRVLFASAEQRLPAAEVSRDLALFTVTLAEPHKIERVLSPEAEKQMDAALPLLQLSPDGTRLCAPGKSIVILDLKTGQVTEVPDSDKRSDVTIPVWQSNQELCFAVAAGAKLGSPKRTEIVLWSPAGSRILSKDWPNPGADGLVPRPGGG